MDGADDFTLNWPAETKMDAAGFGADPGGMDGQGQMLPNPGVTLAGTSNGAYKTHSDQQSQRHSQLATPVGGGFQPGVNDPAAAEAESAASGLFHMAHGRDQESHAAEDSSDLANAVSWGSLYTNAAYLAAQNLNNIRHPMAPNHNQQPINPYMDPNNQAAVSNGMPRDGAAWWSHQLHMPANGQTPYAGLPFNPDPRFQNFTMPQHIQGTHSFAPGNQGFHRPELMSYGSDPNFSTQGYVPPSGYAQLQREKSANLNNVPMANEAAAGSRSHMPFGSASNHGQQRQRHSLPTNSPHQYAGISSPNALGGLPTLTSPANPRQSTGFGYSSMAVPTIENGDGHPGPAYNRPNSGARRQSRAIDDEDDYSSRGNTKTAGLKRKMKTEQDSEDEDEHMIIPAKNKPTPKRRKSSNAQPVFDDEESEEEDFSDDTPLAEGRRKSKSRKSAATNRENLTAEEKRQNHIKSEKQRRDLIKVQYDCLDVMVPGLKGGKSGLSRADIMNEISDYIKATMAGNAEIQRRLQDGSIGGGDADDDPDGDGAGGA